MSLVVLLFSELQCIINRVILRRTFSRVGIPTLLFYGNHENDDG
jgi:hypothetical protein